MQTMFWIFASLMLLVAVAAVLVPLWRQRAPAPQDGASELAIRQQLHELDRDLEAGLVDTESHARSKAELERNLLGELSAATHAAAAPKGLPRPPLTLTVAVLVIVPLVAVGTYLYLGQPNPTALQVAPPAMPGAPAAPAVTARAPVAESMEILAGRLAAKLKANPDDGAGWALLARSYVEMRQFDKAVGAFEQAEAKGQKDAQLLADHADALAMSGDRKLEGKPKALIDQALKLDPNNDKALMLTGSAAFEHHDYAAAADFWGRAASHNPPETPLGRQLAANVAEAKAMLSGAPLPAPAASSPASMPAAAASAAISGEATIARDLAADVAPDDTLFIYARAGEGPKMPLAIIRARAAQLPMHFALDDSMAMTPMAKLSSHATVTVIARVSKSGNAVTQPGDLIGQAENVPLGTTALKLNIDTRAR